MASSQSFKHQRRNAIVPGDATRDPRSLADPPEPGSQPNHTTPSLRYIRPRRNALTGNSLAPDDIPAVRAVSREHSGHSSRRRSHDESNSDEVGSGDRQLGSSKKRKIVEIKTDSTTAYTGKKASHSATDQSANSTSKESTTATEAASATASRGSVPRDHPKRTTASPGSRYAAAPPNAAAFDRFYTTAREPHPTRSPTDYLIPTPLPSDVLANDVLNLRRVRAPTLSPTRAMLAAHPELSLLDSPPLSFGSSPSLGKSLVHRQKKVMEKLFFDIPDPVGEERKTRQYITEIEAKGMMEINPSTLKRKNNLPVNQHRPGNKVSWQDLFDDGREESEETRKPRVYEHALLYDTRDMKWKAWVKDFGEFEELEDELDEMDDLDDLDPRKSWITIISHDNGLGGSNYF